MVNITATTTSDSVPSREMLASVDDGHWNYAITNVQDKEFYITGGKSDFCATNRTLVFTISTNKFREAAKMN